MDELGDMVFQYCIIPKCARRPSRRTEEILTTNIPKNPLKETGTLTQKQGRGIDVEEDPCDFGTEIISFGGISKLQFLSPEKQRENCIKELIQTDKNSVK